MEDFPVPEAEWTFKALADRTRLKLLRVLSEAELSVSELVEVSGLPQSTVSRHLKVLKEAGLVVDRRSGSTVMYGPPETLPVEASQMETMLAGAGAAEEGGVSEIGLDVDGEGVPESLRDRGNGDSSSTAPPLRDWVISWLNREPLDPSTREEVHRVLDRRSRQGSFYDRVGHRWDQLRLDAYGRTFHLEAMVGLLPPEWRVADVGTGTGYLLRVLCRHFKDVIAVDRDPAMLEMARQRMGKESRANVRYQEGALESLPMENGQVDLLVASLVLHHTEHPEAAFGEMRRVLTAGGRLLVIEQEPHDSDVFQERMGDVWRGFTPGTLKDWASAAGFTDIRTGRLSRGRSTGRRMEEAPPIYALIGRAGSR